MQNDDAVEVFAALQNATSTDECIAVFGDAIAPYGLDVFACGEVDIGDPDMNVYAIVSWPDAVKQLYFEGLDRKDPIMDMLSQRSTPFTWDDMRADRILALAGTKNLQALADIGYVAGLVVPFPYGQKRFGLVSLAGRYDSLSKRDYVFYI